jgi:hypothetical protein
MEKPDKYKILYVIYWINEERKNSYPRKGAQRYCQMITKDISSIL